MYKVDLHTHSIASPDGGITVQQYKNLLKNKIVDCIAITDHNQIDFAKNLHQDLGEEIIIGEEIMTSVGEIIGLFLTKQIPPNLSPTETIRLIKDQGGLVYIPHPLEKIRRGLPLFILNELIDLLDIIEVGNGRAFFQHQYSQILAWSNINHIVGSASSDAHGVKGVGKTYSSLSQMPNVHNLKALLAKSTPVISRPSLTALLYPKYNRFRKKFS